MGQSQPLREASNENDLVVNTRSACVKLSHPALTGLLGGFFEHPARLLKPPRTCTALLKPNPSTNSWAWLKWSLGDTCLEFSCVYLA